MISCYKVAFRFGVGSPYVTEHWTPSCSYAYKPWLPSSTVLPHMHALDWVLYIDGSDLTLKMGQI